MLQRPDLRAVLCILAAAGVGLVAAGQAPPQVRAGVDLVVVDVTVLNRGGEPLTELGPEDFTVTVDGRPRAIQSVRLVRADASVPSAAPAPPPSTAMEPLPPRRFVIVIDRQHIQVGEGQQMLDAAARFVDRLAPGDRVAVWATPESAGTIGFSADRERVKEQIRLSIGTYRPPMGPWMVGRDEAMRADDNERGVLADIISRECYKQPPNCPSEIQAQVTQVAMDARHRAEMVLADLGALIDALAPLDGPKHLVLVTEGPVLARDTWRTIATLGTRAALARVTVHALQVQDPSYRARTDQMRASPEQVNQGQSAAYALATTTGGLALTPVSGDVGFQRLERELSASYILVFETEAPDRDGKVHEIAVKVRDRGWGSSVRARKSFRVDPAARALPAPPAPAPAPAPPPPAAPAEPVGIEPGDLADRLAEYAELFEREITAVVAEERFVQIIHPWRGAPPSPDKEPALRWLEPGETAPRTGPIIARRQLLSDVLLVQMAGQQWQSFRDVAEVDGQAVRDRADRVQRLFLSNAADRAARFQEIALESARYNIGNLKRDLNLPTVALSLLRRANHPRFKFKRQKKDETIDGRLCRVLSYQETESPTLISTRNSGDVYIYGKVWIDQADGGVRRTELWFDRGTGFGGFRSCIRVDYGAFEGIAILVPLRMWEWYEGVNQLGRIGGDLTGAQGLATYSKYRRFQVATSETVR